MKHRTYKTTLGFKSLLILVLLSPAAKPQASFSNQTITLHVAELNSLIVPAVPAMIPADEKPADASALSRLVWTSTGPGTKVAVAQRPPQGMLRISVRDLDHRVSTMREVTIRDSATVDLLQGLGRSAGSCTLELSFHSDGWLSLPLLILYTITGG